VEEVACRMGSIDAARLEALAAPIKYNGYGQYLLQLLKEKMRP
jgi:glucose-1-phosphate thymidylyltransferase